MCSILYIISKSKKIIYILLKNTKDKILVKNKSFFELNLKVIKQNEDLSSLLNFFLIY